MTLCPCKKPLDTLKNGITNNAKDTHLITIATSLIVFPPLISSSKKIPICLANINNTINCGVDNWLNVGEGTWTLTPKKSYSFLVSVIGGKNLTGYGAIKTQGVRPAVYLTSDITLQGLGAQGENAFRIVE